MSFVISMIDKTVGQPSIVVYLLQSIAAYEDDRNDQSPPLAPAKHFKLPPYSGSRHPTDDDDRHAEQLLLRAATSKLVDGNTVLTDLLL